MPKTTHLKAAVARANITPPVGIQLCGFAGRGPSVGFGDDLCATALVLSDGRAAAVGVSTLNQPGASMVEYYDTTSGSWMT